MEISGIFIPQGSTVTVNIYDLHHSEKLWKDPFVFDPERFDEDGEGTRKAGEGIAWAPFGTGARQCIGMNFSLTEQRVFLSMLCKSLLSFGDFNVDNINNLVISAQIQI
jgi:cytochrome P450